MIEPFIYFSTLKDMLRPKKVLVWIVVSLLLCVIGKTMAKVGGVTTAESSYVQLSTMFVHHLLALVAAIFSAAVISQEVEQRTIVYLLTRPVPRWKLLVFRTLAACTAVFLVTAVATVFVSLASYSSPANKFIANDLLAIGLGAFAYTSLFVLVSLMLNRSMIFCLLFAFGWETSIPNIGGNMQYLSINTYIQKISQLPAAVGATDPNQATGGELELSRMVAWIVLAGIVAFCLGLGSFWFTHFEFSAREDAE